MGSGDVICWYNQRTFISVTLRQWNGLSLCVLELFPSDSIKVVKQKLVNMERTIASWKDIVFFHKNKRIGKRSKNSGKSIFMLQIVTNDTIIWCRKKDILKCKASFNDRPGANKQIP